MPRMSESIAVGALASNTLDAADFTNVLDQEVWAISCDVNVSAHGFTANQGPVLFGLAHGDYTAAEIEEWLEANASWVSSDKIANEKARRKCRIIGRLEQPYAGAERTFNDGKKLRVKLGFKVQSGETLKIWVYNDSGAQLTAGGIIEIKGPIYLKPL